MSIKKGKLSPSQIQSYEESGKSLEIYMKQLEKLVPLSREEQDGILKEYIDGGRVDTELGHKLIITNQRLVAFICKRYANRKYHYIDLIQEGNVGMLEALAKYDFEKSKNSSFVHFAHTYIFLRVSKYVEKNRHMTHLGHNNAYEKISYNLYKYADVESDMGLSHISKETIEKIATDLNVKVKDVEFMIKYTADNHYVTTTVESGSSNYSEDGLTMLDTVFREEDDVEYRVMQEYDTENDHKDIHNALNDLSPQERRIIKERHLVDIDIKPSLKDIGSRMGISGERVRQIESNALKRLKNNLS